MLDTSVLIDYFRKKEKSKTLFVRLTSRYEEIYISTVIEFEIYIGATEAQLAFWNDILTDITILPFDGKAAHAAVAIMNQLKQKRKSIDKPDLFIAAIALSNDLPIATLNPKHFDGIDGLEIISNIE